MMTQEKIEAAAVAYLEAKLAADTTVTGVVDFVVHPSRSQETPPEDRSMIVVMCGELRNFRQRTQDAVVSVFVSSPADVDGVTLESHGLLTAAVSKAWDHGSTNWSAWASAVAAVDAEWTGGNFHRDGWNNGREDTRWLPALDVLVGAVLV